MSQVTFTGERLHAGSSLFGVDLARHRAPYVHALERARQAGGRLLDLGCGTGYGTAELARELPGVVVGLDRVPPDAASRGSGARWVRADLRGIPLASDSFDLIVSFQVIEHLEDPRVYLEAIARLLAPGGSALITTPNLLTSDKINPFHVHEYESDELRQCLLPWFGEVEMQGIGLSHNVAPYFEQRLERIEKIMRLDPLGLRELLPQGLVTWLFAKGALLVRRGIQESDTGMPDATIEDFPIGPAGPADIDLLAVCRKPVA
ncbi:MAG: class I SAM-dependent methyltransferase [Deltaproteobacteria bacterium]|nr:class I SAM-dependent methyltransferase [Deltaproteobacteria bacterium]